MDTNIVDTIVLKRKERLSRLGATLGCNVPSERKRAMHPFIDSYGVILEIKRASPSRGDINIGLDAVAQAHIYEEAGAAAISILTEEEYFKGSLNDLIAVAASVDTSILRKDFLIDKEEIDISYRCGADAVLLIARILDTDLLISMAKRAWQLGLTTFIECRVKGDIEKLHALFNSTVGNSSVVVGINSRDLATFKVDTLATLTIRDDLLDSWYNSVGVKQEGLSIVMESGIRSAKAAYMAGRLGFTGILVGEAAVRDSNSAHDIVQAFMDRAAHGYGDFWLWYARHLKFHAGNSPMIKICGITRVEDALAAVKAGADIIGFVLSPGFARSTSIDVVRASARAIKEYYRGVLLPPMLVAVVTEVTPSILDMLKSLRDSDSIVAVQLHGAKAIESISMLDGIHYYTAVTINTKDDLSLVERLKLEGQPRVLLDIKGDKDSILSSYNASYSGDNLWLAGGINPDNVAAIVSQYRPELIDTSSGVEGDTIGQKDIGKIIRYITNIKRAYSSR